MRFYCRVREKHRSLFGFLLLFCGGEFTKETMIHGGVMTSKGAKIFTDLYNKRVPLHPFDFAQDFAGSPFCVSP